MAAALVDAAAARPVRAVDSHVANLADVNSAIADVRTEGGGVAELEIHGFIGSHSTRIYRPGHGAVSDIIPADRKTPAARIVKQIDEARSSGARTLLVTIAESGGGEADESFQLYDALRDFSHGGGRVVVYAKGFIGSSATMWMLAGDCVVIDPGAVVVVHSSGGGPEEHVSVDNERAFQVYFWRSYTPNHLLRQWLSLRDGEVFAMSPADALGLCWADCIGDAAAAREIAAEDGRVYSPRRAMLETRPEPSPVRHALSAAAPTVNSLSIQPQQISQGTVVDAGSTRGGNVDNIWPNPGSEINPPPGADTSYSSPEWYGRVNLGASSYSGNWVRSPGLGAFKDIQLKIPASPGESFYIEAQVFAAVAAANKGGSVSVYAQDANGTTLTSAGSGKNDTAAWVKESVSLTMPAGTVRVLFALANGSDANAQAYFDAIYVRRQIEASTVVTPGTIKTSNYAEDGSGNPTAGAKLDHTGVALKVAPGNLQMGSTLLQNTWGSKTWLAGGRFDLNGGGSTPQMLQQFNIASIGFSGGTTNAIDITWANPPPGMTASNMKVMAHFATADPRWTIERVSENMASQFITIRLIDNNGNIIANPWPNADGAPYEVLLIFWVVTGYSL